MSKSNIPQEVKQFVKDLTEEGIYKVYDTHKGTLVYNTHTRTKLPFDFIRDNFRSYCKGLDWDGEDGFAGYVISSLTPIAGFYFKPRAESIVKLGKFTQRLNTYTDYKPTYSDSECSIDLFHDYMARMLPDDSQRHILTQWLAHMFQRPAERPTWSVMLWGEGGTGKGVLYNDILTPLLNNQVAQCNTAEEFLGSHSNALAETMLVMLDDVNFNSDAAATKLKSRQSEPTVRMNPKGEQPYTQNVYSRIIYASNESRPLKLSKTDTRRWFVPDWIGYKVSADETASFFVKFRDWLHNDPTALDGIYHYLMNYSLEGFEAGYVAITPALAQFVSMGESTLEIQVREWLEKNRIFKFDELVSIFDRQPDLAKLYAFNTHENKKVIDPDGKGRSKWFVPKGWGAKEIRAYWNANGKELPSYL